MILRAHSCAASILEPVEIPLLYLALSAGTRGTNATGWCRAPSCNGLVTCSVAAVQDPPASCQHLCWLCCTLHMVCHGIGEYGGEQWWFARYSEVCSELTCLCAVPAQGKTMGRVLMAARLGTLAPHQPIQPRSAYLHLGYLWMGPAWVYAMCSISRYLGSGKMAVD